MLTFKQISSLWLHTFILCVFFPMLINWVPETGNLSCLFAQKKLYFENGKEEYRLGRYISILEDKDNKLNINDAASPEMEDKFVYSNKESLNFGFSKSVFWIRFEVADTISDLSNGINWLLINNDPMLEDVRLYYRDIQSGDSKYIEKRSGISVSLKDRELQAMEFVAHLPVLKDTTNIFYIRVATVSQVIISFNLLTRETNFTRSMTRYFFHGIMFGVLFLIIIYNTFLYFSIKQKTFLSYVLYVFAYTCLIFYYEGHLSRFINIGSVTTFYMVPMIIISFVGLFWLLLTRDYLSVKSYLPSAHKLLNYLIVFALLLSVTTFFYHTTFMLRVIIVSTILFFVLGMLLAAVILNRGNNMAKFFLLALSGVFIGLLVIMLRRNGFLPYNFWTVNALNLGVLWESMVLSYTVGYRFNLLTAEKEKEKELIRNQIAADLHDEIGSNLSTISLQSQLMIRGSQLDSSSKEQLRDIIKTAGITTETIRDIVWFINPFHDNSHDLVIRMKELASKMLINLNYTFNSGNGAVEIFDVMPDIRKRRHIYLIYKEILNNIIKHSKASEVNISMFTDNNNFKMIISDNGTGFDEAGIIKGEGLKNLRNRAAQMNGEIGIDSICGSGTIITLNVPIEGYSIAEERSKIN
ncbi:MAG: 7TM diverse intracellular signaling domain-containing protein [Ignavibacteriaceae bacterium]